MLQRWKHEYSISEWLKISDIEYMFLLGRSLKTEGGAQQATEEYLMWLRYIYFQHVIGSFYHMPPGIYDLPRIISFGMESTSKFHWNLDLFTLGCQCRGCGCPGIQILAEGNSLRPDTHHWCHLLHEVNTECHNLFLFCSGMQIASERLWPETSFSSVAILRNRLFSTLLCKVLNTLFLLWSGHTPNFRSFEHFRSKYLKIL